MTTRSLRLTNGLCCHLHHQPDARNAAALLRVAAGSLHEADRWPGLAHLLEHLLFCGSHDFPDAQRLMPWVQQQGGQVNATTQLSHSAFFFQVPASALDAGVARLVSMLAAPLLTPDAIRQECAVIDAEYRLLQRHAATLSEAALLDLLDAPGQLRRFRVGSQAVFGDNVTQLRQALIAFHQQFYRSGNMMLWLQGPQSLDELAAMAAQYGQQLLPGDAPVLALPPQPGVTARRQLQLPGEESFWLTLLLPGEMTTLRDNVTLLRRIWLDEAPDSLLATLQAAGLCESLSVQWLWRDTQHSWLAMKFSARSLTPHQAQRIEQIFRQQLAALRQTSAAQRQHYARLAREDFAQLAPLEQLRGWALGFAPGEVSDVAPFITLLQQARVVRLLTRQQLGSRPHDTQGFRLAVADWPDEAAPPDGALSFRFYPLASQEAERLLPEARFPLLRVAPVQPQQTLLLRPAFYHTLSDEDALARQKLLRPVLAALRHAGGGGSWQQAQGSWQLRLHLPDDPRSACAAVDQAVQALSAPPALQPVTDADGIAIRQLLAALPLQLLAPSTLPAWLAAWCGPETALAGATARLLSPLPAATATLPPALHHGVTPVRCAGSDQALLLFMPLAAADDRALATLRALALIYEPRFFQRLRVEQQIGYVVTARYQRVADVDGILLALQSPDMPWRALLGHCKRFLRSLAFADVDPAALQQTLRGQAGPTDNADVALEALREQQGLARLTPQAIDALNLTSLQQLHQHLLRARRKWRVLFALGQK